MPSLGELLTDFRTRAGASRNRVAFEAGMDPSYLTRVEHDERQPRREIIEALVRTLRLSTFEANQVFTAAGYAPPSVTEWLTPLQDVADVLNCYALDSQDLAVFCSILHELAVRWRAAAGTPRPACRAERPRATTTPDSHAAVGRTGP